MEFDCISLVGRSACTVLVGFLVWLLLAVVLCIWHILIDDGY